MRNETCEECGLELDGGCECSFEREPRCSETAHDWSREGMGGVSENPGVFSRGGTTIVTRERCSFCRVERTTTRYGVQRNPGQADTRTYEEPQEDLHMQNAREWGASTSYDERD